MRRRRRSFRKRRRGFKKRGRFTQSRKRQKYYTVSRGGIRL